MEPNAKQFITEVDGKTVIFESGMLAGQAGTLFSHGFITKIGNMSYHPSQ